MALECYGLGPKVVEVLGSSALELRAEGLRFSASGSRVRGVMVYRA